MASPVNNQNMISCVMIAKECFNKKEYQKVQEYCKRWIDFPTIDSDSKLAFCAYYVQASFKLEEYSLALEVCDEGLRLAGKLQKDKIKKGLNEIKIQTCNELALESFNKGNYKEAEGYCQRAFLAAHGFSTMEEYKKVRYLQQS